MLIFLYLQCKENMHNRRIKKKIQTERLLSSTVMVLKSLYLYHTVCFGALKYKGMFSLQ